MTIPAVEGLEDAVAVPAEGTGPVVAGQSPWRLALGRLRRDRLTMISLWVVVLYVVLALAAPILEKTGVIDPFSFHLNLLNTDLGGIPNGNFGGVSWHHPLGVVPSSGSDVMSRLLLGISYSLLIAISASLLTVVIGTIMGIVSGFSGGWVDAAIGRFIDLVLSFPQTLMLLSLSGIAIDFLANKLGLGDGPLANGTYVVVVLAAFGWPPVARVIRGQVLSLREREFVEAARLFGASRGRLYFIEILPNVWAPVLIYFTLLMPAYVSAEAALSYLGVGIKPPSPTLGNVLTDSVQYYQSDFTYFLIPGLVIALIVVCFNLVGEGLRDALDPKSSR